MIKDKSIYDPVEQDDGYRVLVMRVVRDKAIFEQHRYDIWMRSLGPETDSLRRWWNGEIDTPTFYAEFRRDVSRRALARLRALERRHGVVTVLCRERRPDPCHRYELVALYRELYPFPPWGSRSCESDGPHGLESGLIKADLLASAGANRPIRIAFMGEKA